MQFFGKICQIFADFAGVPHPGCYFLEPIVRGGGLSTAAAPEVQARFPQMKASWELLGYDAPPTIELEFVDGTQKKVLAEHLSKREMSSSRLYRVVGSEQK